VDLTNSGATVIIQLVNDDPIITNPRSSIIHQEDTVGIWDFDATDKEYNPLVWSIDTSHSWVDLNKTTGRLTLSPDEGDVGAHQFTIRATDIDGGYDEFNVAITITNRPPVIQTINNATATEDSLYSVDYSSDDDPSTTWTLVTGPSWLTIAAGSGILSGTPSNAHVGSSDIEISVTDGNGGVTWINFSLTVENTPPVILTNNPPVVNEDQLYYTDYACTDDGAGLMIWSMKSGPGWLNMDPITGVLSGTPTNRHIGQWQVQVEVNDGNDGIDQRTFSIVVINKAPNIISNDIIWAEEDSKYTVDYSSSDDGQGDILWSLSTNADGWLEINDITGILSGIPRNDDVGEYWVKITVTDDHGGSSSRNFTLTVNNTNDLPIISTADVLVATEDQLYFVDYDGSDVDDDTLTWSLTTDANWLIMDTVTGELSGTPTNLDVGVYEVTISCDDGNNGIIRRVFNLTVLNVNDAPIIDHYSPPELYPTVEEGSALEFNVTYSDEDSITFIVEWSLDGAPVRMDVPFWTYVPVFESAGDHDVIVNITDDGGANVQQRWIVIVTATNRAPVIDEFAPMNLKPILDPEVLEISFTVNATDPDSDQLTYKWFVNGVDTGERTNSFLFRRSSYDSGTYSLKVEVSDAEGIETEQTWDINVIPVKKEENPGNGWMILAVVIIIIIIVIILLFIFIQKRKQPKSKIEDIFIISDAGILLAHKSKELRPDVDDTILSGMLAAIQDFIRDAFKDKTNFGLRRLDFGDSEIRLKRGTGFFLAVVFSGEGTEPPDLDEKLDKTIEDIETNYGEKLENWTGNLNQMRGIKDHLDNLLK
jgi:hypothetical protein